MTAETQLLNEGLAYLRKVSKIKPSESPLANDTIYNIVCLGLETSLTALLFKYKEAIDHGSVSSLIRSLGKFEDIPENWISEARFLNKFNTYCSLDIVESKIPTDEETARMIAFGNEIIKHIETKNTLVLN